jgi:hypothetical protein
MGFVYFIRSPELGLVKIGYTAEPPHGRLKALQTGSPSRLEILGAVPATRETEARFHRRFAALRRHGEWFREDERLSRLIRRVCREGPTLKRSRPKPKAVARPACLPSPPAPQRSEPEGSFGSALITIPREALCLWSADEVNRIDRPYRVEDATRLRDLGWPEEVSRARFGELALALKAIGRGLYLMPESYAS